MWLIDFMCYVIAILNAFIPWTPMQTQAYPSPIMASQKRDNTRSTPSNMPFLDSRNQQ